MQYSRFILSLLVLLFVSVGCLGTSKEERVDGVTPTTESEIPQENASNNEVDSEGFQRFWNFDDAISDTHHDKLKQWINQVFAAAEKSIGVYQFDVYVYFHKSSGYKTVSFGKTSRKNGVNEVHFYLNPEATLDELMEDWVAPHEISHLAIPAIGKSSKWFAEGFATFLSRQVMMELGYYTDSTFDALYTRKCAAAEEKYLSYEGTFIEVSSQLVEEYRYSTMYWGSAGFFLRADQELRSEHGMHFRDVVRKYQDQNRLTDPNLKSIIASWDRMITGSVFNTLMKAYRNESVQNLLKD